MQESRIREILNKYCQFMPYEIYLNPHDEQRPVYDKDGNVERTRTAPIRCALSNRCRSTTPSRCG